jgi:hypothetical protein
VLYDHPEDAARNAFYVDCQMAESNRVAAAVGGVTRTAPSKYHDEIISLVFIHTKYGEPIVIMVFRCTMQKVLCLSPPAAVRPRAAEPFRRRSVYLSIGSPYRIH